MKNKRIWVIGVALVLLVLIAGVAFAASGETSGIKWRTEGERVYLENTNRYAVRFMIQYKPGEDFETCEMGARTTSSAWISGGTTRVQIFNVQKL
jgi:hypothetical protein